MICAFGYSLTDRLNDTPRFFRATPPALAGGVVSRRRGQDSIDTRRLTKIRSGCAPPQLPCSLPTPIAIKPVGAEQAGVHRSGRVHRRFRWIRAARCWPIYERVMLLPSSPATQARSRCDEALIPYLLAHSFVHSYSTPFASQSSPSGMLSDAAQSSIVTVSDTARSWL